jgi:hypothetical protein
VEDADARLRAALNELTDRVNDLEFLVPQLNYEVRKDVHGTMAPIGIDLNEFRKELRHLIDVLHAIDKRTVRLETWATEQDKERIERQKTIDDKLGGVDEQLGRVTRRLDALVKRRFWWPWAKR